jgi:hypothetical protein
MKIRQMATVVALAAAGVLTLIQPASASVERSQGPFDSRAQCVTEQNDFVRHNYTITLQCREFNPGEWWFYYTD